MTKRTVIIAMVAALAGVAAAWGWYARRQVAPWRPALSSREAATRVLAEHLSKRYPAAKVLVIGNPFTQHSGQSPEIYAFEKASLSGLVKGFGLDHPLVVVYPEVRPEFWAKPESVFVDPRTTTPLSYLVMENAFERLLREGPAYEVVVSLIGLPANVGQSQYWSNPDKPKLALLLPDWRMVGSRAAIREAVKSEKIAAAVMIRPGDDLEDAAPEKDYQAEFTRRFFLVTKENIDELLQTYPHLF